MLELNVRMETVNGVEKKINAAYENNSHFERRIIKKSIEEINEKSELYVTYKMIKKKRKYHSVVFYVKEKEVVDEQTIEDVKEPTPVVEKTEIDINGIGNDELFSVFTEDVKQSFLQDFDKIDFTQPDMIKLFKKSYQDYVDTEKTTTISLEDKSYIKFFICFRSNQNKYIMNELDF